MQRAAAVSSGKELFTWGNVEALPAKASRGQERSDGLFMPCDNRVIQF